LGDGWGREDAGKGVEGRVDIIAWARGEGGGAAGEGSATEGREGREDG